MNKTHTDEGHSRVLIVDDMVNNRKILLDLLRPNGYELLVANNGVNALRIATNAKPNLILLDILMPDLDGYEVCKQLKQNEATTDIPIIFITAKGDTESTVEGFRMGGADYIAKPFEGDEVLARVKNHLEKAQLIKALVEKNRVLSEEISRRTQAEADRDRAKEAKQIADDQLSMISQREAQRWGIPGFIGKSRTIGRILSDVRQLQTTGTTSVLITGESGTGKELIARAIHFGGTRAKGPFIPVNCSAIPRELAESEFFGHLRGAFTGANTSRKGHFELATGGTLFLDEIGDMPVDLQAKILRTLEENTVTPVGSSQQKRVEVRVVAATNADLTAKIADKTFRSDLYFRLAGFTVSVPPLRDRREDIPPLVEHFLDMFATEMGLSGFREDEEEETFFSTNPQPLDSNPSLPSLLTPNPQTLNPSSPPPNPTLSDATWEALMNYHFPGNIRELKNIIEHALIRSRGCIIEPEHLHFIEPIDAQTTQKPDLSEQTFALLIKGALVETNGDVDAAAQLLEIDPYRIHRYLAGNDEPEAAYSPQSDEEKQILSYVSRHGSINNTECRDVFGFDLHHASYLLRKMHRYGLLKREGQRRWSRYILP